MKTNGEEDKQVSTGDTWENEQPIPFAAGPDGAPMLAGFLEVGPPIPQATPNTFLCLRGPCRYYLEIHSMADMETRGLDKPPKQINRHCRVIPGIDFDLTDDCVYACSDWDPLEPKAIAEREARRDRYYQQRKQGAQP